MAIAIQSDAALSPIQENRELPRGDRVKPGSLLSFPPQGPCCARHAARVCQGEPLSLFHIARAGRKRGVSSLSTSGLTPGLPCSQSDVRLLRLYSLGSFAALVRPVVGAVTVTWRGSASAMSGARSATMPGRSRSERHAAAQEYIATIAAKQGANAADKAKVANTSGRCTCR